ncbi:MAG TPA: glycoside hydrolase, partial [Thermomicrobiales bacterium]|nr:glycoside hydrolase [Thermomicrobiales bacterium]
MTRLSRRQFAAGGLGLVFGGHNLARATAASSDVEIVVRPGERRQVIDGFGVSGAWWAQEIGGWDDPNRQRVIDLLFDQDRGIGLSLYRYNIGAGSGKEIPDPWRRTETFEVAPGVYDWSKDRNAVWVLKAARDAGVERFVAFANSPPARMTKSGTVSGGLLGGSNLKSDMYPAFAKYLVDITRHLRQADGIPIGWISPINEPQWPWLQIQGQEGCHYSVSECVTMAEALATAIGDSGLEVKMSLPESGEWKGSEVYLDALLGSADLRPAIDGFAIHDYHSTPNDKATIAHYAAATYPETRLWMSEWTEMKKGRDTGMNSALTMASVIIDDLTVANVTSWQFWIAVSKYDYHDGLLYTDAGTQN